jgi:hypothetical protein
MTRMFGFFSEAWAWPTAPPALGAAEARRVPLFTPSEQVVRPAPLSAFADSGGPADARAFGEGFSLSEAAR